MCARLLICMVIVGLAAVNHANAAMTIEQIQKAAQTMRNACVSKVHADPGVVAGMKKGEFPEDQTLKCYTLCILKTMRAFKNGRVDVNILIKQMEMAMPPDVARPCVEAANKCSGLPSTGDDCETSFQYAKCNYQADPEHFFFP